MSVTLQVLGCGDAFGSGGRLMTAFYVDAGSTRFLLDCGATAPLAMKRYGVDPNSIDAVLLTHLHGDHFGGLPFIIREAQIAAERTRPLTIAGPAGVEERVRQALEVFFPGSARGTQTFTIEYVELPDQDPVGAGALKITAYPVVHTTGTNPHALRVEVGGKVIAYSGDTGWSDVLVDCAQRADLFLCEAYTYEARKKNHLDYRSVLARRDELGAKRIVLTHMGDDVLARLAELELEYAEDGKRFEI